MSLAPLGDSATPLGDRVTPSEDSVTYTFGGQSHTSGGQCHTSGGQCHTSRGQYHTSGGQCHTSGGQCCLRHPSFPALCLLRQAPEWAVSSESSEWRLFSDSWGWYFLPPGLCKSALFSLLAPALPTGTSLPPETPFFNSCWDPSSSQCCPPPGISPVLSVRRAASGTRAGKGQLYLPLFPQGSHCAWHTVNSYGLTPSGVLGHLPFRL